MLLREFKKLSKLPFSFNISFDPNEEIVVCILPGTAHTFYCYRLDVLIIGDYLLQK